MVVVARPIDGHEVEEAEELASSFDVDEHGRLVLFAHEKPFKVLAHGAWLWAAMDPRDV